jgi:hypothetical protein
LATFFKVTDSQEQQDNSRLESFLSYTHDFSTRFRLHLAGRYEMYFNPSEIQGSELWKVSLALGYTIYTSEEGRATSESPRGIERYMKDLVDGTLEGDSD